MQKSNNNVSNPGCHADESQHPTIDKREKRDADFHRHDNKQQTVPKGLLIMPDGTEKEITPKNGVKFFSSEIRENIGGYCRLLKLSKTKFMIIDDDWATKQLPFNKKAYLMMAGEKPWHHAISGVVIVVEKKFLGNG